MDDDRKLMDELEATLKPKSFTSSKDGSLLIVSGRWPTFGVRASEIAAKLNAVLEPYMKQRREEVLADLQKRLSR